MKLVRNAQVRWMSRLGRKDEEYYPVRVDEDIVQTALQAWTTNLKKKRHEGLDTMSDECKRSDINAVADDVEKQFVNPGVWMTQEEDSSTYLELLVAREIGENLYEWMRITAVADGEDNFVHFVFISSSVRGVRVNTRFVLDKIGKKRFDEISILGAEEDEVPNLEFHPRVVIDSGWEDGNDFGSAFAKESTRWQSEIETSRDESAEVAFSRDVGADKRIIKSVENDDASMRMTRDILEWMKKIEGVYVAGDDDSYYSVKTEEEKDAEQTALRAWTAKNLKEVMREKEEIIRDSSHKEKESEKQITDLRSKLDTLKAKMEEREQNMQECAEKQKELEGINAQLQNEIASLQDLNTKTQRGHTEQLQRANAEMDTLRADKQAMEEELQTEKQPVDAVSAKVAENVRSFSEQIGVLKSEKEAVEETLSRSQERVLLLQEQLDNLNTEWKAREKGHKKRERELTSEILESISRQKMEEEANAEYDQLFFKQKVQKEEEETRRRLTGGRESEVKLMAEKAEKEIRHAEQGEASHRQSIHRRQQMELEEDRYWKQTQNDLAAFQRSIQEDLESAARQITEREADASCRQIGIQNEEEEARRRLEDTVENEAVLIMERAERDIRQIEEREVMLRELNLRQKEAFHSKAELQQRGSENEYSIIMSLFIGGGSLVVNGLVIFVLARGAYNEMSDNMITIGGSPTGTTGAEANGEVGVIIEIPDDSINAEDGVQGLEEDQESGVSGNEDHL